MSGPERRGGADEAGRHPHARRGGLTPKVEHGSCRVSATAFVAGVIAAMESSALVCPKQSCGLISSFRAIEHALGGRVVSGLVARGSTRGRPDWLQMH
jgi:hypothetical protein